MKNLILKVPTPVFIIAVLSNLILYIIATKFPESFIDKLWIFEILNYIQFITIFIWTISLVEYFKTESNSIKLANYIKLLVSINFVFIIASFYLNFFAIFIISSLLYLVNSILIFKLIKKTFYARSKWFLFLEIFFVIIGIITLTPDVKKWEKSDKK